ncbi:MAG TPA: MerR family transcriptional regulator [Pyrinomonadaceae bacterium]|jgi:DNA-binding transcriptional MerR regulator
MKSLLDKARQAKYVGVAELADEAAKVLFEIGTAQERGTVSEVPDERTIRYYLSEGLLSPAEEKQGTASVFGYRHLLQLLVVKKLQSEHLPIRKIKELVDGRVERDLERLLGASESGSTARNDALRYLETLLTTQASTAAPQSRTLRSQAQPGAMSARAALSASPAQPSPPPQQQSAGTWQRIEIEPGLELHMRGDYQPPDDARQRRRLARNVLRTIESQSQRLQKARR